MLQIPLLQIIAVLAIAPALYALWLVGWPDVLRVVQGVRHVRASVVRHELGSDGFVPVFRFENGNVTHEIRGPTAHTNPTPSLGSVEWLSFPKRRPDLARTPQNFARALMYALLGAWLALFSDMAFGWF